MYSVPRVITSAGTRPKATRAPLTRPSSPPTSRPIATTATIGMPGRSMNSRPVRYAVRPSTEPTDRSTLRVMMTTAWPAANVSRIAGVSSRSRQELALNRKLGVLIVAAAITTSSTMRMDISRDRTTVLKARTAGDCRLGSTRRSMSASGTVVWTVSLIGRPPACGSRRA